ISITTPLRTERLNPGCSAATWYAPGTRNGAMYSPAWLVGQIEETLVSRFVTVTFALATTAPVASRTEPTIVPEVAWGKAGAEAHKTRSNRRRENFSMTDLQKSDCPKFSTDRGERQGGLHDADGRACSTRGNGARPRAGRHCDCRGGGNRGWTCRIPL